MSYNNRAVIIQYFRLGSASSPKNNSTFEGIILLINNWQTAQARNDSHSKIAYLHANLAIQEKMY
jgi:hypothetical protein